MGNNVKTAVLLAGMTAFVILVGQLIGGQRGAVMALILAGAMNFFSYFFSDKIAIMSSGAQPIAREDAPRLYEIVERLTAKANLPMPKLFMIPTDSPNAFATGRNPQHASVAVTAGILKLLTDDELEGVLAHELGHVRNRDILISSVAATLAGAITLIARMAYYGELFGGFGGRDRERDGGGIISALAMMILAPIAALLIQMAVSRSREFQADATGAHFTGNPYALASALRKIEEWSQRIPMAASPATAHLYISMPRLGMSFGNLFSTHPPTAERIARLTGMGMQQTF
ncbi:MAG TPA: zinc metalloprotease HtpX [Candidatus Acidoferrales bacterium]|nr:zinc metalloprotease HtpX [Candidatus Acidoferrales bacterium]